MMDIPFLKAESVVATYGSLPVSEPVSFSLYKGEIGILSGSNGSGKSTLIGALSGRIQILSGNLALFGRTPRFGKTWTVIHQNIHFLKQFPIAPPFLSVEEYVSTCIRRWLMLGFIQGADYYAISTKWLMEVEALASIDSIRLIRELSFGQKRILELSLALAAGPKILVADEPLAGIASSLIPPIVESLNRYVREGGSLIMASHTPELKLWTPEWVVEVVGIK